MNWQAPNIRLMSEHGKSKSAILRHASVILPTHPERELSRLITHPPTSVRDGKSPYVGLVT